VSWELDLWGRLGAQEAAALADLQASQADYAGARLSLIAQTTKIYFSAVEARRQLELASSTLESNRTTTARIRERYERGLRPALDLRLTEANLAASEATVHIYEAQLDAMLRQLETLLGRYPAAEVEIAAKLPPVPAAIPAGLPSELMARRPDLVAAERRLAASGARIAEAQASLYPQFSITASGGTASNELADLVDGDFRVWSLVGNLLAPLFQGGRLRAGVDLAKAGSDLSLALYADSVLRAFAEVETALAAEEILRKQEAAVAKAAEQARSAYEISERRYNGGLLDIVTLLDAQRRLFAAESQLLSVRRARLEARINLHLALGGGFETKE
jgi:NodT family efflux transporter outer membrane factor (OMF) lipoprotein